MEKVRQAKKRQGEATFYPHTPPELVAAAPYTYNPRMAPTHQRLTVKASRKARKAIDIDFLIDSGAVYSLVPGRQLRAIGITPYKELEFVFADGSHVRRQVGDAYYIAAEVWQRSDW